jgi:hypothetical protein
MLLGGKVAPQLSTFTVALAATATYLGIKDLRYMLKTAATLNKAVNT